MRLLLIVLIPLLLQVHSSEPQNSAPRPNFILIFADDLGYGDLGCYGHPTIKTPNLDRLAQEGLKFTQFYSSSPACSASRYSLLTGRYPVYSGFDWVLYPQSQAGLSTKEWTLAEALQENDYATACYGKWHLGAIDAAYLPLQNGFDEYLGLPYSNDMIPPKWPDIALLSGNDTLEMNPDQSQLTRRYTDAAIQFMHQNPDGPFFIYLAYAMPHVPLHPGEAYAGQSLAGTYGDVVEEIDGQIGRLMEEISKMSLATHTQVWFTSDNGPWLIKQTEGGSSGLFRDGKGSTWEGGMRVPAIVWQPETVASGVTCQQQASTLDVFPTLLAQAGIGLPHGHPLNGRDISDWMSGKAQEDAERIFLYYGLNNDLFAIRKGPWKLHLKTYSQLGLDYFEAERPLLFHLEHDPSEKYNVADKHPEIVKALQAALPK
ncbi:MAG TPA: sulfatase [Saprospiraceae bacterium]|nr:sulfatase [Saprospiraceae bacterium]HMQ82334.1 sulfatase [Saprospiraceae bacterium]